MAYAPKIGGSISGAFALQFPNASVSLLSMAIVLVEQLANDGSRSVISHATGFMWRYDKRPWLISARHVFSGTSPFDDSLLSQKGYRPERLLAYPSFGIPGASIRDAVEAELYCEGCPLWLEDPEFDALRVDIAALGLDLGGRDVLCVNDSQGNGDHELGDLTQVGSPCVVIGYPNRNVAGLMTPIWRTGSLASEPLLPIDGKPMFLIDAATSPGFSGAPVFRTQIAPAVYPESALPSEARADPEAAIRSQLVGIYAGRLTHPYYGGEVPFVFYANRIERILSRA
jgi:hypothetical protein